MLSDSHFALLCCLLRISMRRLLPLAGVGVVCAAYASCLHAGWRLCAFAAWSPGCPLSDIPSSILPEPQFIGISFSPSLPSLPCTLLPCISVAAVCLPVWPLLPATVPGQALLLRFGCCCAWRACFLCFAAWRCAAAPFVTAVCLPDWPLFPALVPGWACCCISGAVCVWRLLFLLFFLAVGCVAFWFSARFPASCRAPRLLFWGRPHQAPATFPALLCARLASLCAAVPLAPHRP